MINTVENIQNLFVHEVGGHWVHGYNTNVGLHYKAYELQMNYPTFKYTTPYFRKMILNAYKKVKAGSWQ